MKGYTIIELIILISIVLILVLAVWIAIRGGDPNVSCEVYSGTPFKDVPARCVQYFEGGK